jgi:carbamoyltransferase
MNDQFATLGIYAIQDRFDTNFPQLVHDHGMALMNNGMIEQFIQLERITRQQRDNSLHKLLPQLIADGNLASTNMDVVFVDNVVGRAMISSNGQIRFEAPLVNRLTKDWENGRLFMIDRELDSYVINHEIAHLFSCLPFYGDFKENSLLIHFDGGASFSNFSAWMYRMGKIIPVEHHWELKYLTSLFNANALVFGIIGATEKEMYSVPEKTMGFAALGSYNEDIEFWLRQNKWFSDIWNKSQLFFDRVKVDFNIDIKAYDQRNTFLHDVVATIQEVFMRETLLKLDDVNSLSNCKNLYYTGGCALNTHANSSIVESQLFENIYIPPCPDDTGLSLGAAAYGEWKKGHQTKIHSPYLNNWGLNESPVEYSNADLSHVAQLLVEGKVIALFQGNGEAGPRALGNRSILALPTKALAHKVSIEHKQREWYQPVAPIMLEKNARYFSKSNQIHPLSRFMLIDVKIAEEKQHEIPGVIHANGTARLQALFTREENAYLWDLLSLLDEQFNIKALINTSFSNKGAPIVHTETDAINSVKAMGIDVLILNGKVQLLHP